LVVLGGDVHVVSFFDGKYGAGRFPFGKCGSVWANDVEVSKGSCANAACHRLPHGKSELRVCRAHLPPGTLFSPFMGQQEKMFHSKCRWVLGGGGAGGSKTFMGSRLYMKQLFQEKARFENNEIQRSKGWALFLRRTIPEVQQVISEFLGYFKQIDPSAKWDDDQKIATFPCAGGFKVQFGNCESEDSWQRYWGGEFSLVVFDESVTFTFTQIKKIDLRLRSSDPVLRDQVQLYLLTNPINGAFDRRERIYTHEWLKAQFVDPYPKGNRAIAIRTRLDDGREVLKKQIYIPASLYDNPALVDDGDYEASIKTHSEAVQKALLYCSWDITEGSWVGEDWDKKVHVISPFQIPQSWYRFKCGGYGYDARASINWVAVDPDDNWYVYRHLSTRQVTAKELGIIIRSIESESLMVDGVQIVGPERDETGMSTVWGPMDSSLWSKVGETGPSRAEEMNATGAGFFKSLKDPDSMAEQIRNRLRKRVTYADGRTVAGLQFFSTCVSTIVNARGHKQYVGPIHSFPLCPTDPHRPSRWDTSADDHDLDSIGYGCLSRPLKGLAPANTLETANRAAWESYNIRHAPEEASPFYNWRS
jgi:hypothetical protein